MQSLHEPFGGITFSDPLREALQSLHEPFGGITFSDPLREALQSLHEPFGFTFIFPSVTYESKLST
jgi:hypothetical protein